MNPEELEESVRMDDETVEDGEDSDNEFGLRIRNRSEIEEDEEGNTADSEEEHSDEPEDEEMEPQPPVTFPSESIRTMIDSCKIATVSSDPAIASCLGEAALKQLKNVIMLASQIAFHERMPGIRVSDFTYAQTRLNSCRLRVTDGGHGSTLEEPEYDASANGFLAQKWPTFNLDLQNLEEESAEGSCADENDFQDAPDDEVENGYQDAADDEVENGYQDAADEEVENDCQDADDNDVENGCEDPANDEDVEDGCQDAVDDDVDNGCQDAADDAGNGCQDAEDEDVESVNEDIEIDPENLDEESNDGSLQYADHENEEENSNKDSEDESNSCVSSVESSGSEGSEEKFTLAEVWVDYMDLLVEEFFTLNDHSSTLAETVDNIVETSEFYSFVEDIAEHGLSPVLLVWCDFCSDFIAKKFGPHLSAAGIHGILSLFDAILKNRFSGCLTSTQMKGIFGVLVEILATSPHYDVHTHLVSTFDLVFTKTKDDLLLEMLSWVCSFVTESLEWYGSSCFRYWSLKSRVFHIALLLANELERLGCRFSYMFQWHCHIIKVIKSYSTLQEESLNRRIINERLMLMRDENLVEILKTAVDLLDPNKSNATISPELTNPSPQHSGESISERETSKSAERKHVEVESSEKIAQEQQSETNVTEASISESVQHKEEEDATMNEAIGSSNKTDTDAALETEIPEILKEFMHECNVTTCQARLKKIVSLFRDKRLAENWSQELGDFKSGIKTLLRNIYEEKVRSEVVEMKSGDDELADESHSKISLKIGKPEINHTRDEVSHKEKETIHADVENGILMFFKQFFQNYADVAPPDVLVQLYLDINSYFGERLIQFISFPDELTSYLFKRRKIVLKIRQPIRLKRSNPQVVGKS